MATLKKLPKNYDRSLNTEFEIERLSENKICVLCFRKNFEVLEPKDLRNELRATPAKIQRIYS